MHDIVLQRPIVLTCNNPTQLASLDAVQHFRLQRPSAEALLDQLVLVAAHQGIPTTVQRLADISHSCNYDIRSPYDCCTLLLGCSVPSSRMARSCQHHCQCQEPQGHDLSAVAISFPSHGESYELCVMCQEIADAFSSTAGTCYCSSG